MSKFYIIVSVLVVALFVAGVTALALKLSKFSKPRSEKFFPNDGDKEEVDKKADEKAVDKGFKMTYVKSLDLKGLRDDSAHKIEQSITGDITDEEQRIECGNRCLDNTECAAVSYGKASNARFCVLYREFPEDSLLGVDYGMKTLLKESLT